MKFYVLSDSYDGKEDIQGLYYLISDRGQYIDVCIAKNSSIAYEELMKRNKNKILEKYGEPCEFMLLKDGNISKWELKILNRAFEKRRYNRAGKPIGLRDSNNNYPKHKRITNKQLMKEERAKKFWKTWWRIKNNQNEH